MPRKPAAKKVAPKAKAPNYLKKIKDAIVALKDRTGVSPIALEKYILANHKDIKFERRYLRAALKRGVATNEIAVHHNHKGSYKLAPKPAPAKKTAPAKKKVAAKKKAPAKKKVATKKKAPAKKKKVASKKKAPAKKKSATKKKKPAKKKVVTKKKAPAKKKKAAKKATKKRKSAKKKVCFMHEL